MRNRFVSTLVVWLIAFPAFAQQAATPQQGTAQDNSAMEQRMRELEDRVIALEGQIRMLKAGQAAVDPRAAAEEGNKRDHQRNSGAGRRRALTKNYRPCSAYGRIDP